MIIINVHVIKVITYPTAKTISDSFFVYKPLKGSNFIIMKDLHMNLVTRCRHVYPGQQGAHCGRRSSSACFHRL